MSEAIRVQVEMKVKVPKGLAVSRELAEEVLQKWIKTGTLPPGFKVRAIHWDGKRSSGDAYTQDAINDTVRRLLRRVPFDFSEIRIS